MKDCLILGGWSDKRQIFHPCAGCHCRVDAAHDLPRYPTVTAARVAGWRHEQGRWYCPICAEHTPSRALAEKEERDHA